MEKTKKYIELNALCKQFRKELITLLHSIQTGHPGGSLSAVEILTVLYFDKMNINPANPLMENRDRFVLSKGHAAPILYLNLAEKGYFPKEELKTLRQMNSNLQGHPCAYKTPGVDLSTGPLGLGMSAALGMALAEKQKRTGATVYVLMGDGEIQEGIVWEASLAASKFKADNLLAILDNNNVQLDGTLQQVMPMGDLVEKFTAFGWEVLTCDGHDIADICETIDQAKDIQGKPKMILARTVKGKGISFMEGKSTWHGKPIDEESYKKAMKELEEN